MNLDKLITAGKVGLAVGLATVAPGCAPQLFPTNTSTLTELTRQYPAQAFEVNPIEINGTGYLAVPLGRKKVYVQGQEITGDSKRFPNYLIPLTDCRQIETPNGATFKSDHIWYPIPVCIGDGGKVQLDTDGKPDKTQVTFERESKKGSYEHDEKYIYKILSRGKSKEVYMITSYADGKQSTFLIWDLNPTFEVLGKDKTKIPNLPAVFGEQNSTPGIITTRDGQRIFREYCSEGVHYIPVEVTLDSAEAKEEAPTLDYYLERREVEVKKAK